VRGNGKFTIACGWGRTAKVWDIDTGEEKFSLQGNEGWICNSVAISADGTRVATASDERDIRIWNLLAGPESRILKGHPNWVAAVALSADGPLAVSGGGAVSYFAGAEVKVWDADTGGVSQLHCPRHPRRQGRCHQPRWPAGRLRGEDGAIRAWDARTGREQYTRKGHAEWVRAIAISRDGRRIASGSLDHTVKVWAADTGQEILTFRGHAMDGEGVWDIAGVCFSPDGLVVSSGSGRGFVKVWEARTGEERLAPMNHTDYITCLAWSADGKHIVSGGGEKITIWDAATGKELRTLTDHADQVQTICVSPDGRRIVSGGGDTVKHWDFETGQQKLSLAGHENRVAGVAIGADGRRIVSAGEDRTVKSMGSTAARGVIVGRIALQA
jgi:WD40 repeat protein